MHHHEAPLHESPKQAGPRIRALHLQIAALLLATLLLGPPAVQAGGAGDLVVNPTRAVLEGRDRTADLVLISRATTTATYRISFTQMRMTETGQLIELADREMAEMPSDGMIRFSPRQVVLEPGVAQTVRLFLRKPPGLEPGEYRSHLCFRALPEEPANDIGSVLSDEGGLQVRLTPVYGVSIPVIVRHGDLSASIRIEDLQLVPPDPPDTPGSGVAPSRLAFTILREGDRSIYGDITVVHHPASPADASPVVVGRAHGLAVYVPLAQRRVTVPIQPPPGHEVQDGRLELELAEPATTEGHLRATASLTLG